MLHLKSFCFNEFQQNTYLIYDDDGLAFIIDPGNSNEKENTILKSFISDKKLKLQRLLLTHAHIDHVLGNCFIFDNYGLLPEVHADEMFFLERMPETAELYGFSCSPSPMPNKFIKEGDIICLGQYEFKCIFTPGHSPGSISFYNPSNLILISGDVLFQGSIGRSDLPGGDHEVLIHSIKQKLMLLPDHVKVYSGHGSMTTIGFERSHNPFLKE